MKIAIVNDMPLAVEALRRALAFEPAHEVIWVASNGAEAVQRCAEQTPDLLLMDLIMPVMDGIEATRRIMADTPCAIVIVTVDRKQNVHRVFEAMGHGALDVVDTPALGGGDPREAAAPLLRKILNISWLIGQQRASSVRPVSAPLRPSVQRQGLVAIGSSAGGPAALEVLLKGLPKAFPASIVLVQHVDQVFAAGMAEWLSSTSGQNVRLAREGEPPQPGQVLLAGTNHHIRLLADGTLAYTAEPVNEIYRPSIDVFFESVARFWRGDAVGVLLTGMGRDGAQGLKLMREQGYLTIAQDQQSSAVYGMPKAAVAIDAAVEVRPLERIAPRLMEIFSKGRYVFSHAGLPAVPRGPRMNDLPIDGFSTSDENSAMVLLVDDQAMIGEAVRRGLAHEENIDFHFCADPHEAVAQAIRIKPTVILQDLIMPGLDGLTLVREYRANPATQDIPIIVLSTKEDPLVKSAAFAAGANDYLVKLPDTIELVARIRYHSRSYLTLLQHQVGVKQLLLADPQRPVGFVALQRLMNSDGLTGLSNRRHFDEYLELEWRRAMREQSQLSLLMIDVDYFKSFNDTFGHLAGDEALRQVAEAIRGCSSRPSDLPARYGGEEFALVLPNTSPGGARLLAEKLRQTVAAARIAHIMPQPDSFLSVSIGIATQTPPIGSTCRQLISAADNALYQAKNNGRNQVGIA